MANKPTYGPTTRTGPGAYQPPDGPTTYAPTPFPGPPQTSAPGSPNPNAPLPGTFGTTSTLIDQNKAGLLQAMAQAGQQGVAAYQRAKETVGTQQQDALNLALQGAQNAPAGTNEILRSQVEGPSQQRQQALTQAQANLEGDLARQRSANSAFLGSAQAVLPIQAEQFGQKKDLISHQWDKYLQLQQMKDEAAALAAASSGGGGGGGGGGSRSGDGGVSLTAGQLEDAIRGYAGEVQGGQAQQLLQQAQQLMQAPGAQGIDQDLANQIAQADLANRPPSPDTDAGARQTLAGQINQNPGIYGQDYGAPGMADNQYLTDLMNQETDPYFSGLPPAGPSLPSSGFGYGYQGPKPTLAPPPALGDTRRQNMAQNLVDRQAAVPSRPSMFGASAPPLTDPKALQQAVLQAITSGDTSGLYQKYQPSEAGHALMSSVDQRQKAISDMIRQLGQEGTNVLNRPVNDYATQGAALAAAMGYDVGPYSDPTLAQGMFPTLAPWQEQKTANDITAETLQALAQGQTLGQYQGNLDTFGVTDPTQLGYAQQQAGANQQAANTEQQAANQRVTDYRTDQSLTNEQTKATAEARTNEVVGAWLDDVTAGVETATPAALYDALIQNGIPPTEAAKTVAAVSSVSTDLAPSG